MNDYENITTPGEERGFLKSKYKYAVNMEAEGFDMDTDDWTITVSRGPNKQVFDKTSASYDSGEGQWYILVDTDKLGAGQSYISFEAKIPDTDDESGYRWERVVYKFIWINL